jgi:predicted Fe-Mo cluster-binding NifX family protein
MKAAFAVWDKHIAPVFDVTRQVHLVDAEAGKILGETQESLPEEMPTQKALRVAELDIQTLVCGAISRHMQDMVEAGGIRVIPFVTGELREVIHAWLIGSLGNGLFSMPGCHGRRRRRGFGGLCRREQEEYLVKGGNRMEMAHVEGKL